MHLGLYHMGKKALMIPFSKTLPSCDRFSERTFQSHTTVIQSTTDIEYRKTGGRRLAL